MKIIISSRPIFFFAVVLTMLSGCATSPTIIVKVVESNNWLLGQGPLISELIILPQNGIKEVALRPSAETFSKGKFETDIEFEARKSKAQTPVFLVVPIRTTKEDKCESVYDREKLTYSINSCLPFLSSRIVTSEETYGDPLKLANAYDSRFIKRKLWTTYRVLANFDWRAEYKVSINEAKLLDEDLMAGIIMLSPKTTKTCELCNSRDMQDSVAELSKSIAAVKGKSAATSEDSWQNIAFKEGEILERWDHAVAPGGAKRVVIFRKSDQRVLSDKTYARVSE